MANYLTNALREYLKSDFSIRYHDSWSCSELGKCLRWQYFRRIQAPWEQPKNVLNMTRAFSVGNAIDTMFKSWLTCTFQDRCRKDVPVMSKEFSLTGMIDAVIDDIPLEIKSANSYSYKKLKDNLEDAYFWKQIQAYTWLYGSDRIIVVVFNVDSKTWFEESVDIDWNTIGSIMDDLQLLTSCLESNEPPPVEECGVEYKSCPYTKICRKLLMSGKNTENGD